MASPRKALKDPRIDPRVKRMLAGQKQEQPQPGWTQKMGGKEGLSIQKHEIQSRPDGNAVDVLFVRPDTKQPLPCIVYLHGGGMAMGNPLGPPWNKFGRAIAQHGVCVAMPDFRNYAMPSRPGKQIGKFPAGLNDCMSALEWVNENKALLGIGDRVLIAGESGGGNLAMATAMRCKREGKLDLIQGFYVLCPYIAGSWPDRPGEEGEIIGTSHMKSNNDGILIKISGMAPNDMYAPRAVEERNPLAWPGLAKEEDLAGLPPGVISVDECDPLRDEGVNFYRLLLRAKVRVRCVMQMGVIHGGHLLGSSAVPELTFATARSLADAAFGEDALLSRL